MAEVERAPDPGGGKTFRSWSGPNMVFWKVKQWSQDMECGERHIGAFFQYCSTLVKTVEEGRQLFEWWLKLVSMYVQEDERVGWESVAEDALLGPDWAGSWLAWDWSQLEVGNLWEVPPPEWAISRENQLKANEEGVMVKESEVKVTGMGKVKEDDVEKNCVKDEVKKNDVKTNEVNENGVKENEVKEYDVKEDDMKEDEVKENVLKEVEVKEDEVKEVEVKEITVKKNDEPKEVEEEVEVENELQVEEVEVENKVSEEEVEVENELKEEEIEVETEVKDDEVKGEVASPCSSWGSLLPLATPKSSKLLPTWRPWEMEKVPKVWQSKPRKKRSPASEARSRRRLLEWQWHRDSRRGLEQLTPDGPATPLPPPRRCKNVRLLDRLEGEKLGSQAPPPSQWSGKPTSPSSPSWSGSQTLKAPLSQSGSRTSPLFPHLSPFWSGSQTFTPSPSQFGSQTSPTWSGDQGPEYQDYWLSAGTSINQTMPQQSLPPLAPLPSPIPGFWPPPSFPPSPPSTGWTAPAGGCTWGTLPALVTTCPSCHAWGLLAPN